MFNFGSVSKEREVLDVIVQEWVYTVGVGTHLNLIFKINAVEREGGETFCAKHLRKIEFFFFGRWKNVFDSCSPCPVKGF